MKTIQHLFTGADNATHDLGRWSWAGSFLSVVVLAGWKAWHGTDVGLAELSQALAVVAAAHGVALFAKQQTEPKA
jgi:hypothetical protein